MTPKHLTLNNISEGQKAKVISISLQGEIRRRIFDLGIINGTLITCLQKSPTGDPVAYFIRGTVIALRANDSKHIMVENIS